MVYLRPLSLRRRANKGWPGLPVAACLLAAALVLADAPPRPEPGPRKHLPPAFAKSVPGTLADLRAMEQHVKGLLPQLSPAVVEVEVGNSSGSGVVISADGLVLTAGHVCGRPGHQAQLVFPGGKRANGKTLGAERDNDTGLIRITDPGPWPHVAVGEKEPVQVGDWVLALGHPGGFDATRSLVVRLGRVIQLEPDALQTDCTISPGDSGGPLFDMHGRVVGIHSYISTSMAENYHVPISQYYEAWESLAKGERPKAAPAEVEAP